MTGFQGSSTAVHMKPRHRKSTFLNAKLEKTILSFLHCVKPLPVIVFAEELDLLKFKRIQFHSVAIPDFVLLIISGAIFPSSKAAFSIFILPRICTY